MKHYITYKIREQQTSLWDYQTIKDTKIKTNFWEIKPEKENELRIKYKPIIEPIFIIPTNVPKTYNKFKIPKQTGGMREIESPTGLLRVTQTNLKYTLEKAVLVDENAYAYVKGKSIKDCVEKHKENESNYFLHLDLKDFFGSCTREFVFKQLGQIIPFSLFDQEELKQHIEIAFKEDDGLPQGAPTSPVLSNIIMIPIDFKIQKMLKEYGQDFVYTRYADDIIISNKNYFNYKEIVKRIKTRMADTPLKLNEQKTHFGTRAGKNWILGVMLNRDNNITIGHRTKESFRAYTFDIVCKLKNNQLNAFEASKYLGLISYYDFIETGYSTRMLEKYAKKINLNLTGKQLYNKIHNITKI